MALYMVSPVLLFLPSASRVWKIQRYLFYCLCFMNPSLVPSIFSDKNLFFNLVNLASDWTSSKKLNQAGFLFLGV